MAVKLKPEADGEKGKETSIHTCIGIAERGLANSALDDCGPGLFVSSSILYRVLLEVVLVTATFNLGGD